MYDDLIPSMNSYPIIDNKINIDDPLNLRTTLYNATIMIYKDFLRKVTNEYKWLIGVAILYDEDTFIDAMSVFNMMLLELRRDYQDRLKFFMEIEKKFRKILTSQQCGV